MNRDLHARHPSERWGPAPSSWHESLDPSFRWEDVKHNPAFEPIINSSESNA